MATAGVEGHAIAESAAQETQVTRPKNDVVGVVHDAVFVKAEAKGKTEAECSAKPEA